MARILVTGATGFIGKRLIYQLLDQGHEIYALVRLQGMEFKLSDHPRFHTIYGDIKDRASLDCFPKNIDAAYYLVHSMGSVFQNLTEEEETVAHHFIWALEKTECKQIIFLSGIIEDEKRLSPHLRSRLAVEKILKMSRVPSTTLRASIIIGSGSASFEIIRDLVEKLPMMIAPKWVKNMCQPIGIRDVLFYLTGVLLNPSCFNRTFDIGGPEAMSFKDVLLRYARFRKLRRWIIDVPVLTPRLSSYWLVLITSVRLSICSHLVESMKLDTRKLNLEIDAFLPHKCMTYEEALALAFQKIAQNEVLSTWMDSWDLKKLAPKLLDYVEVPQEGCLKDIQIVPISGSIEELKKRVWSIGGEVGWYSMNWAWRIRGLIDQLLGGTGLNRGRRHPFEIEVGDSIDFWRVLMANDKTIDFLLRLCYNSR